MHSSTRITLTSNEKEGTQYHPLQSTELLTVKDVAEILRVPVSWVYDRTRKRSFDRLREFVWANIGDFAKTR